MAVFEISPTGPRSDGLGGAGTALSGDGWSKLRNPASVRVGRSTITGGWSQQFGLPELTREAAGGQFGFRSVECGIAAETFGGTVYRESTLRIQTSHRPSHRFSMGAELAGHTLEINGYPGGRGAAVTVGVVAAPIPDLKIGAVWRNVARPRLSTYRDRLPESLTMGIVANLGARALVVADLVQERYFPLEVRGGGELLVLPQLSLRVGARAEPFRPAAGFSARMSGFELHYAGDIHPDLGASHSVGLEFRLP